MRNFTPTDAQRAAIQRRGCAILVSAGAGSGKTRVLTQRLMAQLCDPEAPVDLDRFLIITFTRAAAGELRGRIMQELAEALAEDPGSRRLRRQSALLRRAQIGTIHSFCSSFLREHSHLAGIAPDFAVLDEQRGRAMKARALERVLELCYDQPESEIPMIPGDPERLKQVFLNLLDNAAKHGGEGGRVEVAIAAEGSVVIITIRDHGHGIPENELPHVKEKFYKGSSKNRGTGIGLSVCDEIVARHGGRLMIDNAEGGGCLVTVTLPLRGGDAHEKKN